MIDLDPKVASSLDVAEWARSKEAGDWIEANGLKGWHVYRIELWSDYSYMLVHYRQFERLERPYYLDGMYVEYKGIPQPRASLVKVRRDIPGWLWVYGEEAPRGV